MNIEINKKTEVTYQVTHTKHTHSFVFRAENENQEKTLVVEVMVKEEKCFYPFEEYFQHITEIKFYDTQNPEKGCYIQSDFNDFDKAFREITEQMFGGENEEINEQVAEAIDYLQDEYGLI